MILVRGLGLGILLAIATPAAIAQPRITAAELGAASSSAGLIDNSAFTPSAHATPAREPFFGTLCLSESPMHSIPIRIAPAPVLGRDPQLFPAADIAFFTDEGDLVPFSEEVIRVASADRAKSFWDLILQPGRVWSEPEDGGWSRAAFPFALVNSIEGETHNGLATFLYRGTQVSNVRFQIVQQTAPYLVQARFTATGLTHASFVPASKDRLPALRAQRAAERRDAVRIADWAALAAQVGADRLEGFDDHVRPADLVLSGLDYRGTFYLKECTSAEGPLPWCDRARFGVWSVTKAAANETALLRLAQKYGPGVFELRIRDYVPEAAAYPGWSRVRFEDAIDMATGIGNGSTRSHPNDIEDGYLDPSYDRWYAARSVHEKVAAMLRDGGVYPWGPGKVARYRDQDMFILGVAMDRFLKSKEGPEADLWTMLEREVFGPIGIHQAPINRTIEPDGAPGQPIMAYGYYPTLGDLVHIARLYQNGGKVGERQLLYAARVHELLAGTPPKGLPTGKHLAGGETTYANAFWVSVYTAAHGCRLFYPRMLGWGGNIVSLLPQGLTGIRLAKGDDSDHALDETDGMARVADRLVPACP
jgi:Beta-lactamase